MKSSYGRIIRLVRTRVEAAPGRFTTRDIFEQLRFEPGITLYSVRGAVHRLRKSGEVIVLDERVPKSMIFKRANRERSQVLIEAEIAED